MLPKIFVQGPNKFKDLFIVFRKVQIFKGLSLREVCTVYSLFIHFFLATKGIEIR